MTKKHIMIVEDQGITALDEQQGVINLGYEVTSIVMTGEAAITHAIEEKPDLILMDIMLLGEMTGDVAAMKIREQQNIPVIFVSAVGSKNRSNNYDVPEGCGYIVKPYDIDELQSEIERIFRNYEKLSVYTAK